MAKTFIPFNVNDRVRVRLTDFGRTIHREWYRNVGLTYRPPKEDENGWSEWQMWCLIDMFGAYFGMGRKEQPFETNIEIELKQRGQVA